MRQLLLSVLLLISCALFAGQEQESLKLGVLAYRPKPQVMTQWQPLADYLQSRLERPVDLSVYDHAEILAAVESRTVDLVITTANQFILLQQTAGLSSPLATLIKYEGEYHLNSYGAVILTRADREDIQSLTDLADKRIAIVSLNAFGGYQMPALELVEAGVPLPTGERLLLTGQPHDRVIQAVLEGRADAGFIRAGLLESLAQKGELDPAKFKVINRQQLPEFPFAVSTRLYPEWPVVIMPHIGEELARRLAAALYLMPPEILKDSGSNIYGFGIPANYDGVESLLRNLRLPPFDRAPTIRLIDLWYQYSWWIMISTAMLLLLALTSAGLFVMIGRTRHSLHKLAQGERHYRTLAASMPDNIIRYDQEGRANYLNPALEKLLGIQARERIGKRVREFHSDGSYESYAQALDKVLATGESQEFEFRMPTKSGNPAVYDMRMVPERNERGEITGALAISHDISEQKQMEMGLRSSEQLFRSLVEHSPDYIARYDRELRRIYINPALQKQFTASTDEILGKPPTASSILSDPERYMACIKQAFETATEGSDEHSYLAPDGTLHWANSRFIPEFAPDGEVTTVMTIASDITERKLAEQEHQFHAELLTNIDRINRAIQSAQDLESMMRDVLDEVLAIFGSDRAFLMYPCDPNAKLWTVPMERFRPEYPGAGILNEEIAMSEEVATTLELLLNRTTPLKSSFDNEPPPPGTVADRYGIKSFMSIALFPKLGKPWQFGIQQCSYARNWTDAEGKMLDEIGRRIADGLTSLLVLRDLRESQRQLVEAQRLATLGNWELDLVQDTLTWSDEIFRIFEIDKEKFGASYEAFLEAIHPDDRERVNAAYTESLKDKQPYNIIHRLQMKDGRIKFVNERCETYFDPVGTPIRSVGTVQDITEQKLREDELKLYRDHLEEVVLERTDELQLARDAAEAANKAKSVFLANMSHELRTPLNAILGFSHMMQQDTNLSAPQHETLDIINNSGEHLLKLINDVLEIAKIEAGKLQLEIATFDLHAMVREVADMMRLRAQQKGLQLELDQSSEFPRYIKGDEARLRQILVNLVSNAVKFTDAGSVTIRLSGHNNTQHHLLFEIADTGPGISAEDQQQLFKPFVQLPEGKMHAGTGLGLSIVHQFITLMNGSISVKSKPGKGSQFRVMIPLDEAEETEIDRLSGERHGEIIGLAPGQPSYRILIAEDQHDNQLLLTKLMTDIGMKVKTADNGKECVEIFKKWKPDLIWMDQRMPIMDGVEATKKIRKLSGGKKVKIVAVTASAFKEQEPELRAAGMDDYVRKPYRFSEIYDSMARQLGVEFLYSETDGTEVQQATTLTSAMLAKLDDDIRQTLYEALNTLDSDRIAKVIQRIAANDSNLARLLSQLADNYDYPTIILALDDADR